MIRFLESLSSWGGVKRDVVFLILSGLALVVSLIDPTLFPIHPAWAAILLCGVPILLEAVIGLVTAFDIKADVLVSIALIASVAIGEIFAAGEVAFIMQLGGLLEELTVGPGPGGHRAAGPPHAPHRPTADGGRGGDHLRRRRPEGRPAPGAPGGDRPRGRVHPHRTDLHQPGGHDRRVPAGGQGAGGRGVQRHGKSVRLL